MEVITVRVRYEGGSESDVDVPPEGSVQRELFDDALAKGRLVILDEGGAAIEPTLLALLALLADVDEEPVAKPKRTRKPKAEQVPADDAEASAEEPVEPVEPVEDGEA